MRKKKIIVSKKSKLNYLKSQIAKIVGDKYDLARYLKNWYTEVST